MDMFAQMDEGNEAVVVTSAGTSRSLLGPSGLFEYARGCGPGGLPPGRGALRLRRPARLLAFPLAGLPRAAYGGRGGSATRRRLRRLARLESSPGDVGDRAAERDHEAHDFE